MLVYAFDARDSRELMYECVQADAEAAHLADKAIRAFQSGDLETEERLFSELGERVHQWSIKRIRDTMLEVRCPPTEPGSNGHKAKGRAGTRSDLYFSSS